MPPSKPCQQAGPASDKARLIGSQAQSEQIHLPQPQRPGARRKRRQLDVFRQPHLPALFRSRSARHGNALGRIVLGMTTRAQHHDELAVRWVVAQMRHVQHPVRYAALLAHSSGRL